MTSSVGATFATAAIRHFDDATALDGQQRWASADHLAGFAAECALKALIVDFLGAQARNPGDRPYMMQSAVRQDFGHLPSLWGQVAMVVQGRAAGSQFGAFMTGGNPFSRWKISDRYQDGRSITASRVRSHLQAARRVIGYYQQAAIGGTLI